jgi:hypothetical protein
MNNDGKWESVWPLLTFSINSPANLDRETRAVIIHHVKSAQHSFAMLIQSFADDITDDNNAREQKKLIQLKRHEEMLRTLTDKFTVALSNIKDPVD